MGSVKAIIPSTLRVGNVTSLIQRDTQQGEKVALSLSPGLMGFGVSLLWERATKQRSLHTEGHSPGGGKVKARIS